MGAQSAFPLGGLLPTSSGQLRWPAVLIAKIPAGFGPQRPKPQACAAPTGEVQTRVNPAPRTPWPLALGQTGEYFQLQNLPGQRLFGVCLSPCPLLTKPLRQGLNHGVLFGVLLLDFSQERTHCVGNGWRLAGRGGQPCYPPARAAAESRAFQGLGFLLPMSPSSGEQLPGCHSGACAQVLCWLLS